MIQRIQTIFYLLAAGSFGSLFHFPFASTATASTDVFSDKLYNVFDNPVLMVMAGLGALLGLVALLLFKNRSLQLKLGNVLIILSVFIPIVAVLLFMNQKDQINTDLIDDQAGIYIPVVSLIFAFLANRFVKKDEKTVRSMDRLR